MSTLTFRDIHDDVLAGLGRPRGAYWLVVLGLAATVAWALSVWVYQVREGMGVTGVNHPVGWAIYIANFVFWVGIAHSGTLISAILHLVRSKWRSAVARTAEAMTVFAVITAGLFPLIHLGRLWVFWYILPYPSQRQLWPNFMSPLVWDVVAVSTYLTVSTIFWYVGLIPDLAAARDRFTKLYGPWHPRTRWYRRFALGWTGSSWQWRHYGRAYLYFAALATPLVISVHSVVSWDFAMGLLPGWHTTIFPPYFVAGAIHSGLAMVITLLVPMRKLLKLERVITIEHFEAMAQTMIVTTLIVGYAYVIEPFIAWYSGDPFEQAFAAWRASGEMRWGYFGMWAFNVLAPLAFLFRRARRTIWILLVVAILVNVGMWLERYVIVTGSLAHDFLPHTWGLYYARWVEISISIGSLGWFLFWFFLFAKHAPTVAMSDVKEVVHEREQDRREEPMAGTSVGKKPLEALGAAQGLRAVFATSDDLVAAVRLVRQGGYEVMEAFSPLRLEGVEAAMGVGKSPVRFWTLTGAAIGCATGFGLAIGSAMVNQLIVGGKPPTSIIPYCVIGFEGTILFGTLFNLGAVVGHSRLGMRKKVPLAYDARFGVDRFGLFVACPAADFGKVSTILHQARAEEVNELA